MTGAQRAGATPAARLAANLNGGVAGRPACIWLATLTAARTPAPPNLTTEATCGRMSVSGEQSPAGRRGPKVTCSRALFLCAGSRTQACPGTATGDQTQRKGAFASKEKTMATIIDHDGFLAIQRVTVSQSKPERIVETFVSTMETDSRYHGLLGATLWDNFTVGKVIVRTQDSQFVHLDISEWKFVETITQIKPPGRGGKKWHWEWKYGEWERVHGR